MVILRQDGLEREVAGITPPTNDHIIALLSSSTALSLFSLINEKTPHAQFTDTHMIQSFESSFSKSKLIGFSKLQKSVFTVNHSQCQVSYDISGFKLKNIDKVSQ